MLAEALAGRQDYPGPSKSIEAVVKLDSKTDRPALFGPGRSLGQNETNRPRPAKSVGKNLSKSNPDYPGPEKLLESLSK